jgi:hypothetical protein
MSHGEKIDWHIDRMPPGVPPYYQRYQIPLQVAPGTRFCVADVGPEVYVTDDMKQDQILHDIEELCMEPGTAW